MTEPTCIAFDNALKRPLSSAPQPPWPGLAVLLLAAFVTIFDLFVVNVAIPSLQADLGATLPQIGWIVAGYELAFGVLLVTGSRLGDRHGRRRLFVLGMLGFTAASALCGLAPTVGVLIAARVLQGLAAALLFPQIYASIRVGFSGADSRRAFGWLGMALGFAAIAGQIAGGWLVQADWFGWGWRTIFLVNIPIGLLAMAAARWIPETRAAEHPALDGVGVVLLSLGLAALLLPLLELPGHGWQAWSTACLGAAMVLLALFYHQQERRRLAGQAPLMDMALLRQPRFAQGGVLVLLVYSTSSSFFLSYALLMQVGLGMSPLAAGTLFVPCSIGFVAASLAAPRLVARFGMPGILAGGVLYTAALAVLIAQVAWAGGGLVPATLVPALTLVGAGQGLIMTPLINLVLGFVAERHAGMAAGVVSTLQQVGAALGVALVGALLGGALHASVDGAAQAERYAQAFVSGMLCNLVAAGLATLLLWRLARYECTHGDGASEAGSAC